MKDLIKISRPRFWIYTFGPFILPVAMYQNLNNQNILNLIVLGLFFLFPANILIYGINDIYDYETDKLNQKKEGYESKINNDSIKIKKLIKNIVLINIPFIVFAFVFLPKIALIYLTVFLITSWQYSALPLRAKAIPFIDSLVSGVLYIMPAGVSFGFLFNKQIPMQILLAGIVWSISMHAYSAIPDINADKLAKIKTGATTLGKQFMTIICWILFTVSGLLAFKYLGNVAVLGIVLYSLMIIWTLKIKTPEGVLQAYKFFPYINTVFGAIIFFSILLESIKNI